MWVRTFAAILMLVGGGAILLLAAQSNGTPPPSVSGVAAPSALGLSGCAARGCHGGPLTNSDGTRLDPTFRNACSHWLRHDPHSQAYRTLFGTKANAIMRNLTGPGKAPGEASTDVRCLACHVTPSLATATPTPDVLRLRIEGVSCDACHTTPGRATSDWLEPHKKGGASGELARCFAEHGLHWLGTARSRAMTCAGCHVGAPADMEKRLPLREVSHDLVAAGHPRLNFDYPTFLAALPPHWTERRRERDGSTAELSTQFPPRFDVEAWFVGTVESTRAGLLLLADEAERGTTWPELAAFNCYACHHDLTPGTAVGSDWRQRRSPPIGALVANTVPDPLRELLRDDAEFVTLDRDLAKRTTRLGGDRLGIATTARKLAKHLEAVTSPRTGADLVRGLHLTDRDLTMLSWDAAAQTYYALVSVNRERDRHIANRERDAADESLAHLADRLRLPRTANSPIGYDPRRIASEFRTTAEELTKWFQERK